MVPNPLEHSTPQRNGQPTGTQGLALSPPPFPENLRQQLSNRGGQLNNAGFVPNDGDVSVEDVEDFIRNSELEDREAEERRTTAQPRDWTGAAGVPGTGDRLSGGC